MGLGTGSGTLLASEKEHCYLLELSVANANQVHAPPKKIQSKTEQKYLGSERPPLPSLLPGPGALRGSLLHHQLIPRSQPSARPCVGGSDWFTRVWQEGEDQ